MCGEKQYYLRNVIGEYMTQLGEKQKKIVIVNADLAGTCRNRDFVERFPERAFNVGIAEQNMVSFAAGLAHEGFIPFVFSMAPFISMRACEQCRTDVAYANMNVRMIAPYAGCSGGISGATHWGIEDCAIMSSMPNMTVLEPCDPIQAIKMMEKTLDYDGPIYLRSGVEPVNAIYDETYHYEIGKASIVSDGNDGAFICSGITVQYAVQAAIQIARRYGKTIRVVDMHTIKPIDRQAIIDAARTAHIVVAQDHSKIGGLGQQVAEVLVSESLQVKFANLGIDKFVAMAHAPYLYHLFGYDAEGLEKEMVKLLQADTTVHWDVGR